MKYRGGMIDRRIDRSMMFGRGTTVGDGPGRIGRGFGALGVVHKGADLRPGLYQSQVSGSSHAGMLF